MEEKILLADFPKLPLPDHRITELVEDAHDWAHAHGLVLRTREYRDRSDLCQTAPIALLPSPFPRKLFQQAKDVQNLTATLYHDIAYDYDFLLKTHTEVAKTDPFVQGMIDILLKVREQGLAQPISLLIQRSDYMCHKDPFTSEYSLKQVEVNNIASSMGGHAERTSKLHRRMLLNLGYSKSFVEKAVPENEPISLIAEAIFEAWKVMDNPEGIILVVVEDINQNQIDQRHIEYLLMDMGISVDQIVRKTLTQCAECLTLDNNKDLILLGSKVSVCYFRSGYVPQHYPTEKEWNARLTMELSTAIKSPWIGLQLANTKKTQQTLAEDGVVEKFVGKPRDAAAIRAVFAGLWAVEGEDPLTQKLIQSAIAKPNNFVLKPQLEGGGGNFYGDEVAEKLKTFTRDEKAAHILMERLQPVIVENYMIRSLEPVLLANCVSELGIYGYAIGRRDESKTVSRGHLLRTKGEKINEGGVAVGAAVIDSPFLYELL